MIELETDMWSEPADAHVITTNGDVNQRGEAVMGRGCALEAKRKFSCLATDLGMILSGSGPNQVFDLGIYCTDVSKKRPDRKEIYRLVSFPVKHHWHQRADLGLIRQSASELVSLTDRKGWHKVVIVRPGCGNGHLQWESVKPVLEPIFDDRFVVVHKRGSR